MHFKDPQLEKSFQTQHRLRSVEIAKIILFTTSISFITDYILDAIIAKDTLLLWLIPVLYICSFILILLTIRALRRCLFLRRFNEALFCFLAWVILILTRSALSYNDSLQDPIKLQWNLLSSLIFLFPVTFGFHSLHVRIIHLIGIALLINGTSTRDVTASLYQIKIGGALACLAFVIFYCENVRRKNFLKTNDFHPEFTKIIDTSPHGIVILNSQKSIVYSNSSAKQLVANGSQQLTNEGLYESLNAKFPNLKLLSSLGRKKHYFSFSEEIVASYQNSPRSETGFNNDSSFSPSRFFTTKKRRLLSTLESPNFEAHSSLNDVVALLLNEEEYFRKSDKFANMDNSIIYTATCAHRDYELHFSYTASKLLGSIILRIVETTLSNENHDLRNRVKSHDKAVAYIVHELRTPLSSSLYMLQNAIEDSELSPDVSESFLLPAKHSLKMLLCLVNDILDLGQINENRLKLTYQKVNLDKVIQEALDVVGILASYKKINLAFDDSKLPMNFSTDPNRLTQVLMNLLSNAIKFTDEGGSVAVSAEITQLSPCTVRISVKDTGIGIKEDDQLKLFQDYTKIDLGDKAMMNSSGCGLGLNFANKIAMILGRGSEDRIRVQSKWGVGSIFSFCVVDKSAPISAFVESFESKAKDTCNDIDYNENFEENIKTHIQSQVEGELVYKKGMASLSYLEATKGPSNTKMLSVFSPKNDNENERSVIELSTRVKNKQIHRIQKRLTMLKKSGSDEFHLLDLPDSHSREQSVLPSIVVDTNLLVADDDAFSSYSMEVCLNSAGLKAHYCSNGEEACLLVEKKLESSANTDPGYKVIFMDCHMPKMDGMAATKRIRELLRKKEGLSEQVVIIGTTAQNDEALNKEMIEAGMNEVVIKPIVKETVSQLFVKYNYFKQDS